MLCFQFFTSLINYQHMTGSADRADLCLVFWSAAALTGVMGSLG